VREAIAEGAIPIPGDGQPFVSATTIAAGAAPDRSNR
jgi:hypothetical protein